MKSQIKTSMSVSAAVALLLSVAACGSDPSTGVTLQSNPLAGPSQGSIMTPMEWKFAKLGEELMSLLVPRAHAAVNPFNTFKVCVSEVVYELASGVTESSSTPLQPGLLDFSPSATTASTIGTMDIAAGSSLKNIKFTIATVPALCQGAAYAVLYNAATTGGDIEVTQDMSFQFDFAGTGLTIQGGETLTLLLGDIVNGMYALGATLDNTTIQTVNVGQAK